MIISAHHNGCHSKRPNPSLQRLICSTMIPGLLHQLISSKILQQHLGGKLPLNNHIPEHLPFQLKTPFPDMRSLWRGQARLEVIWVFHLAHRRLLLAPQKKRLENHQSHVQTHKSIPQVIFLVRKYLIFLRNPLPEEIQGQMNLLFIPSLK